MILYSSRELFVNSPICPLVVQKSPAKLVSSSKEQLKSRGTVEVFIPSAQRLLSGLVQEGLNRAVSCPEDEAKAKFLEAVSSGREPANDKSWSSYRPNLMDRQDCTVGYCRSRGSRKGISG